MSESNSTTQDQFALTAPPENREYERKQDQKARSRRHYEANREAVLARQKAYNEANKEKRAAYQKAWYEANKEKHNGAQKAWRELNKERLAARQRARYQANRAEIDARNKAWEEANPEAVKAMRRAASFRRKYGLTVEAWEAMLASQGGRCAGCGTVFGLLRGSEPHVDHCHRTGAVRGLLCGSCNHAIGHAGDNPKTLRALARYLERVRSCP
jgi:hypothetical protein